MASWQAGKLASWQAGWQLMLGPGHSGEEWSWLADSPSPDGGTVPDTIWGAGARASGAPGCASLQLCLHLCLLPLGLQKAVPGI